MTKGTYTDMRPGASRLASDVFDSNRLWFYPYKRFRPLTELGYTSVAVRALGRIIRVGRKRLSCAGVRCGVSRFWLPVESFYGFYACVA